MNTEWTTVYELASDIERIRKIQWATENTEEFGLVPKVALFGTDEWWRATRDGRIPRFGLVGNISRVFMSGHADWPEFEVTSAGQKTTWSRFGNPDLYCVGDDVRITYVFQDARKHWLDSQQQKTVLKIETRPRAS